MAAKHLVPNTAALTFYPLALAQSVSNLIYMDVDTLWLADPVLVWEEFGRMANASWGFARESIEAPETEICNWYTQGRFPVAATDSRVCMSLLAFAFAHSVGQMLYSASARSPCSWSLWASDRLLSFVFQTYNITFMLPELLFLCGCRSRPEPGHAIFHRAYILS